SSSRRGSETRERSWSRQPQCVVARRARRPIPALFVPIRTAPARPEFRSPGPAPGDLVHTRRAANPRSPGPDAPRWPKHSRARADAPRCSRVPTDASSEPLPQNDRGADPKRGGDLEIVHQTLGTRKPPAKTAFGRVTVTERQLQITDPRSLIASGDGDAAPPQLFDATEQDVTPARMTHDVARHFGNGRGQQRLLDV